MSAELKQRNDLIESYNCPEGEGVLVDGNKYFWRDKKARLCVELYARALEIGWGSDERYWKHSSEKIPYTDEDVDVAGLLDVCWLDVKAEFDTRKLTLGTEYEIFFDIELRRDARGWNCQVTFEHDGPFGLTGNFETSLDHLIGAGRVEISVGKFAMPSVLTGSANATFKMYEHGGQWKHGLMVRGVFMKPAIKSKYSLQ